MEQIAVFEEKVAISPMDLRPEIRSMDDILLKKARAQIEGKCSKHGYVVPNSLEILSRSLGVCEKGRFTSDFLYRMKLQGKVYNPPDGFELEVDVIRKNKAGLYVIVEDAIRVMIPRDLHIGNEEFDAVEIGDRIKIVIRKSRFQVNDTHILSIGEFVSRLGEKPTVAVEEKKTSDEEEGELLAEQEAEEQEEEEEEEEGEEVAAEPAAEEEEASEGEE
jgi:hypothetical protein